MRSIRSLAAAVAALSLLVACSDEPTSPDAVAPVPVGERPAAGRLDAAFSAAAGEFHVPASLLKAVGYVETRWHMVQGHQEFEGMPEAHGLMALRGEQLQRGASLARVPVQEAKTRPEANIRAAAALLSAYADELKLNRADLAAWAPAVARYSGIRSSEGQAIYVHYDVYATLQMGVVGKTPSGNVLASLVPTQVTPNFPRPQVQASAQACAPDYCVSGTVWRPSPNYNDRPTGDIGKVAMIIIHTCEGSYTSCWSWLTNSDSKVSAHYVVKEDGSEVSQLVYESKRAWHIGSTYDCSLNSSVDCWRNGYSNNHFTVGIEHGGYASQSSWPVSQIDKSAHLACDITKGHSIPRDKYHILGHAQLQPYNRTDPGANWPWTDYYNRINSHCGATSIIVDSNNNNNDTSKGYIEVSSNWIGSSSTAGYYGTGYYYASTQAISDPATFWFYLPAAATKTVDAWWTAGTNRSSTAPFIAWNASGTKLGTVYVNQQADGGKWNQIGSWSFSAGWNKIQLSRWTTEGYVVIADAVRIR